MRKLKSKYRLLVLMDFSEASFSALKYAINLSKRVNTDIHILHVIRTKKQEYNNSTLELSVTSMDNIQKRLSSIVDVIKDEGIRATHRCLTGKNVKDQIKEYITQSYSNFNVVVSGKSNTVPGTHGEITSYLLNEYSGALLLVREGIEIQANTNISFGCNDEVLNKCNLQLLFELHSNTKTPLTILNVGDHTESHKNRKYIKAKGVCNSIEDLDIRYENLCSSTIILGLLEHVHKEDIDLFCMEREKRQNPLSLIFSNQPNTISEVAKAIKIPLLILGVKSITNKSIN